MEIVKMCRSADNFFRCLTWRSYSRRQACCFVENCSSWTFWI